MPTYVYACDACGKQFEQFQSFKDEPLTVCRCGSSGTVRRVIQPAGIVFKGSGWYINDSRGTGSSTVGADAAKKTDEKADVVATTEKTDSGAATTTSSDTTTP
ncbi:zinc ribbon domain-containing protein [Candidatus Chloroploca sp. M-50]|uniref:Zinc ribbon domain-containing protein n=1 Tax=Candidatus Chloroploca mongolica TaxID=2528176 RepID=A0ABS4DCZ5_9CHLR|nr:FmdB family zinc ribbon protein [Candidatus Chloroploca mongolica]MBP1467189.1 zinc ribbon domain-containing protein [Candidatus Chloroploca mongolica]